MRKRYVKVNKDIFKDIKFNIEPGCIIPNRKKVFYHWSEWSGWRFYRKAIFNLDFKSIIGHIKSNWLTK